jgi:fucose 4-O-acetylase-like acetyltransferase
MGGALWFLKILFMISVSYCIADFLIKSFLKQEALVVQTFLSIILLIFGYWCKLNGYTFGGLAQTSSFYSLYFIGHVLNRYNKSITWNWMYYLPLSVTSFTGLFMLRNIGSISLNLNYYTNPIYLLLTSFLGWVFIYSISYLVKQFSIKKILIGIGRRTLIVVMLHFLAFKLVALLVAMYYSLPSFCISVFPNLYGERGLWWLAYTVVGVGIPVFLQIVITRFDVLIKKYYN